MHTKDENVKCGLQEKRLELKWIERFSNTRTHTNTRISHFHIHKKQFFSVIYLFVFVIILNEKIVCLTCYSILFHYIPSLFAAVFQVE